MLNIKGVLLAGKGLMFTINNQHLTWFGFAAGHFAQLAKPLKGINIYDISCQC
jgi:hypothetical protein